MMKEPALSSTILVRKLESIADELAIVIRAARELQGTGKPGKPPKKPKTSPKPPPTNVVAGACRPRPPNQNLIGPNCFADQPGPPPPRK